MPNPAGRLAPSPAPRHVHPPAAISSALQTLLGLAAASMDQRGASGGVRTTLDLPRPVHLTLKRLATDEDTSLQALMVAAILQTHPDLAECVYGKTCAHQGVRAHG